MNPTHLEAHLTQEHYPVPDWLVDYFQQRDTSIAPFRDWMNAALYHPAHGYYTQKEQVIGTLSGDFVTAPELSPLFGKTLAKSILPWLNTCEHHILEFGAGRGQLAVDIYQALLEQSIEVSYTILEVSPQLAKQQQQWIAQHLPQHAHRFNWLTHLPDSFSGVILANEVLDAMPVDVIQIKDGEVFEACVEIGSTHQQMNARWHYRPAPEALKKLAKTNIPDRIFELSKQGLLYQTELHSLACAWLQSVAQCLTKGAILMFDYGFDQAHYYHPQRHMGTLNTHFQHRSGSSPLANAGQQDITSHVNFSALYESLAHAPIGNVQLAGYTRQNHFLIQSSLLELAQLKPYQARRGVPLQTAINILLGEHEMGELFKAMAFVSDESLLDLCPGFSGFDDSGFL